MVGWLAVLGRINKLTQDLDCFGVCGHSSWCGFWGWFWLGLLLRLRSGGDEGSGWLRKGLFQEILLRVILLLSWRSRSLWLGLSTLNGILTWLSLCRNWNRLGFLLNHHLRRLDLVYLLLVELFLSCFLSSLSFLDLSLLSSLFICLGLSNFMCLLLYLLLFLRRR